MLDVGENDQFSRLQESFERIGHFPRLIRGGLDGESEEGESQSGAAVVSESS